MRGWGGLIAGLIVIWLLVTFWWVIVGAGLIWLFYRSARKDNAALLGMAMVATAVYVLVCAALHNWVALAVGAVSILLGTTFNWERLAAVCVRRRDAYRARLRPHLRAQAKRTVALAGAGWDRLGEQGGRLNSTLRVQAKRRYGAKVIRVLELQYPTYVRRSEA